MPCSSRMLLNWRYPSTLQRTEVPKNARSGRTLMKLPPSTRPVPVIVPRIGMPWAATVCVIDCSSPRRMRGARRPMIAPPGIVTSGSRVKTDFVKLGARSGAMTTSTSLSSSTCTKLSNSECSFSRSGNSRPDQYQRRSGSTYAPISGIQVDSPAFSTASRPALGRRIMIVRRRPTSSCAPHFRPQYVGSSESARKPGSASGPRRRWKAPSDISRVGSTSVM